MIDLVDRGVIRVIDLAFMAKDEDGTVGALDISNLAEQSDELKELLGASSNLLSQEDLDEAANALDPGTAAAILVYENTLGRPVRDRAPQVGRAAGRQRPDPRPAARRGARRQRSCIRLEPREREEKPMPGLLRGVARTAVIAGTATSVSNRVSRRQGERWAQQGTAAAAGLPGARAGSRAAAPQVDVVEQLEKLGDLRDKGVLTEEEFEAQKAKLLG